MTHGRAASILMVDDNPQILLFMKTVAGMLVPPGAQSVVTANGGIEAWNLYRKRAFDIVVSDVRMPDMSGTELARNIRSCNRRTIIILISGYCDTTHPPENCIFIAKPFTAITLLNALETAIRLLPNPPAERE